MRWARFRHQGGEAWGRVEGEGAAAALTPIAGAPWEAGGEPGPFGPPLPLAAAELLPPCRASKIVCVGRNFGAHARELGHAVPGEPLFFLKPPSALLAPGAAIMLPPLSRQVEHEGELALIVGKRCGRLGAETDIRPYIFGFTCLNDVTARDLREAAGPWTRSKGFDTFCPLGPWLETAPGREPRPWHNLEVETLVNGELRQRGNTTDFLFSLEEVLRSITAVMTLEPGDVVATGTPPGVGRLATGDRVAVRIGGIGTLENSVREL